MTAKVKKCTKPCSGATAITQTVRSHSVHLKPVPMQCNLVSGKRIKSYRSDRGILDQNDNRMYLLVYFYFQHQSTRNMKMKNRHRI